MQERANVVVEWLGEPPPDEVLSALPFDRLGQCDGRYLVAWCDGMPVGHLHLAEHDVPELQDVFVEPAHRGRGVASALIDAAERASAARGCTSVRIEVSVHNDGASALYCRLGYEPDAAPPRRVQGTIVVRSGTIEVDDELQGLVKRI